MRNFPILIGRELKSLVVSPILWVILVLFLFLNGIVFWLLLQFLSQPMAPEGAPMQFFFGGSIFFWLPVLAITSLIPMGSISSEIRNGTIETLMTAPVSEIEVILSKFSACWLFYMILWVPTFAYAILLMAYGEPELGPIFSGYAGTFLIGGAFLSIGVFMSTLTKNQIVSFFLAFVFSLGLWLVGIMSYLPWGSSTIEFFLTYLNVWDHMDHWGRGLVDTRHIVYCLSIMILFLFCAIRALESKRMR